MRSHTRAAPDDGVSSSPARFAVQNNHVRRGFFTGHARRRNETTGQNTLCAVRFIAAKTISQDTAAKTPLHTLMAYGDIS